MNTDNLFPSKFLKASDLQGKEVRVEIFDARIEDMSGDGTEEKLILYFNGKQKGLALNRTNFEKIKAAYGKETDDWLGKTIFIYPDVTQFKGQTVDCLRVRVPLKQAEDSESPF